MNYLLIAEIIQVIISLVLVALVLIQYRGKGLASAVGSNIQFYGSRRGLEKIVLYATIVTSILFAANTFAIILLRS